IWLDGTRMGTSKVDSERLRGLVRREAELSPEFVTECLETPPSPMRVSRRGSRSHDVTQGELVERVGREKPVGEPNRRCVLPFGDQCFDDHQRGAAPAPLEDGSFTRHPCAELIARDVIVTL